MYWRSNEAKEKFVRTRKTRGGKKTKKEMADTKEKFVRTYGGGQTREKKVVGERTDTRERKKADTHG
jgi:hypothetical protein